MTQRIQAADRRERRRDRPSGPQLNRVTPTNPLLPGGGKSGIRDDVVLFSRDRASALPRKAGDENRMKTLALKSPDSMGETRVRPLPERSEVFFNGAGGSPSCSAAIAIGIARLARHPDSSGVLARGLTRLEFGQNHDRGREYRRNAQAPKRIRCWLPDPPVTFLPGGCFAIAPSLHQRPKTGYMSDRGISLGNGWQDDRIMSATHTAD